MSRKDSPVRVSPAPTPRENLLNEIVLLRGIAKAAQKFVHSHPGATYVELEDQLRTWESWRLTHPEIRA